MAADVLHAMEVTGELMLPRAGRTVQILHQQLESFSPRRDGADGSRAGRGRTVRDAGRRDGSTSPERSQRSRDGFGCAQTPLASLAPCV